MSNLLPGEIVADRNQLAGSDGPPDPAVSDQHDSLIVVVEVTDKRADEAVVYQMPPGDPDRTVADFDSNSEHPDDDQVIRGVYLNDATELGWEAAEIVEKYADGALKNINDIDTYSFPKSRLMMVEDASENTAHGNENYPATGLGREQ